MKMRFCTSCQVDRDASTGEVRRFRTTSRWVCQACIERKSESIYRNHSDRSADVAKLMDDLHRRVAS